MNFEELNEHIPFVKGVKLHTVTTQVAKTDDWQVIVKSPGKYQNVTGGGDFVVILHAPEAGWKWHRFTHIDLFKDIEAKVHGDTNFMQEQFAPSLANVIYDKQDPMRQPLFGSTLTGIPVRGLLVASQALALAEHRRYKQYEANGGGRFLPARFALGIVFGKWTALDAASLQLRGTPGLLQLEKLHGTPPRLKALVTA